MIAFRICAEEVFKRLLGWQTFCCCREIELRSMFELLPREAEKLSS
jgi:hypothetical protein